MVIILQKVSLYPKNLFTSSAFTPSTPSFSHHFRFSSLNFPGFNATILPHLPCLHIHTYLRYLPFLGCGTVRGNPPPFSHLQYAPVWFFFSFLLPILRTFRLTHLIPIFSLAWVNCLLPICLLPPTPHFWSRVGCGRGPLPVTVPPPPLLLVYIFHLLHIPYLTGLYLLISFLGTLYALRLSLYPNQQLLPPCLASITLREKSKKKKKKSKKKSKSYPSPVYQSSLPLLFFPFSYPANYHSTLSPSRSNTAVVNPSAVTHLFSG